MGAGIVRPACGDGVRGRRRPTCALAMNVSAHEFRHPEFVPRALAVIDRMGVDPQETHARIHRKPDAERLEGTVAKMTALKERGESFSLDDFGTGYSSLSYLKHLPLDQLKIDRSFVRDILTDSNDAALARTIMPWDSLGLAVIAEGVETVEQRDFLADQGCRAFQGYLYQPPGPVELLIRALIEPSSIRRLGAQSAGGIVKFTMADGSTMDETR